MIHIKGGVLNPAFIELAHITKARLITDDEHKGKYCVFIEHEQYFVLTEMAVVVRFNSGAFHVWGGSDADAIIQWYGIEIPEGMFEGPAPQDADKVLTTETELERWVVDGIVQWVPKCPEVRVPFTR